MPKKVINALNAGELSPYLYARNDLEKFNSGCIAMENFMPLPYGGCTRRPALKYLLQAQDSDADTTDDKIRLIPFTASVDNSFVVELGIGYIRIIDGEAFVTDGSSTIILETPYAEADLYEIKFAQSVDVMWLVHPEYPVKRLSRVSATEWNFEDDTVDFPALLDENDTDITLSPSATTGEITLTASRAFFDSGHVGSYFVLKSKRVTEQKAADGGGITSAVGATYGYSNSVNASNSNWSFSTTGQFQANVVIQKSNNNSDWEDYIYVGNTLEFENDSGARKNFTASSDEPEPWNTWLRVFYHVSNTGTAKFNYELKIDDPDYYSLVKITGYTSSTSVTAEVLSPFQDVASDYSEHDAGTTYGPVTANRTKVYVDSGLTAGTTTDLSAIDASLTNIKDAAYGADQYWFITDDGAGSVFLRKVNSGLTTLDASYDLSTQFYEVRGVTFYGNQVYVSGGASAGGNTKVYNYSTSGVVDSNVKNFSTPNALHGFGYYNGYFYDGRNTTNQPIRKYDTNFNSTGITYSTGATDAQQDITGYNGRIYVANENSETVDVYTEDLDLIVQESVSSTDTLVGILYDGSDLCIVTSGDDLIKYAITETRKYYEYVHVADDVATAFATQYVEGRWAERNPVTTDWSEGAFSGYRGYPSAVALHENRLCYGGTTYSPDTVWLSKIDDYIDFGTGSLDTDSLRLTMGSGQLNAIKWMVSQQNLIIGTSGGEWTLGPSSESEPITPTAYNMKRRSTYGTKDLQGLLVNNAILFSQRQGRKVREWLDQYLEKDPAQDLTILAEHITDGGIVAWDYQQQPDSILWCVRNDGTLLGFTYERDQNVMGWHRHANDQFVFESVAVIPSANGPDKVYVSVKATINSEVVRYICLLDDREWGTDYTTEWQGSDLYKTFSSPGTTALTGLDHAEGETITITADGAIKTDARPRQIVVADAGTAAANGTYTWADATDSWVNGAWSIEFDAVTDPISPVFNIMNGGLVYYYVKAGDAASPDIYPDKTGWFGTTGDPPAPTLSYSSGMVVENGTIVLDADDYAYVVIGLGFTSQVAPLYIDISSQYGTSYGNKKGVRAAKVHFKDTFSAKAGRDASNLETIKFEQDDSALYSDIREVWVDNSTDYLLTTYIVQDQPMPCTVLALIVDTEVRQ